MEEDVKKWSVKFIETTGRWADLDLFNEDDAWAFMGDLLNDYARARAKLSDGQIVCLRNLGAHCFDLFLLLTGEEARVTAAQLSRRVHGQPVEDYASVLLRSAGGVLSTIEVGNTVPYDGSDGEWKLAGRDAILALHHDDTLRVITATGEETAAAPPAEPLYLTCVRDILDHWRRGAPPPTSVHDLLCAVRLIDEAYALAAAEGTRIPP